jgi:hypothetical protein
MLTNFKIISMQQSVVSDKNRCSLGQDMQILGRRCTEHTPNTSSLLCIHLCSIELRGI